MAYKVVWLKNRTNPHVGNLKEDYNLFKSRALQKKQDHIVDEWVEDKIKVTYIRITETYRSCPFRLNGWMKI
jgi:peptidyl-prolyl cis-trans isomerase SurA